MGTLVEEGQSHILLSLIGKLGLGDMHCVVGDVMDVFDAAERYTKENRSMIILAGKDYGSGKHVYLVVQWCCELLTRSHNYS